MFPILVTPAWELMTFWGLEWQLPANHTMCDIDDDFEVFRGVTTNAIVASVQSNPR